MFDDAYELKPFPAWLKNGIVIGKNIDGEYLAVGVQDSFSDGEPWLYRLAMYNRCWVTIRRAIKEDLDKYDAIWLKTLAIAVPTR